MDSADLEKEIHHGKGLLTEIVRACSDFLERLENLSPVEIYAFEERRKRLLRELLDFQAKFRERLAGREKGLPLAMEKQLEEFRIFQEVFVQIVMEKNGAIIARAKRSLEKIRSELDAVGRGRLALAGYNRKRSQPWKTLEKMV